MHIKCDGFNTNTGIDSSRKILTDTQNLIDCVQNIISICDKSLKRVEITNQETLEEKQKTIVCIMLIRILETSEAILCLAKGGFGNEINSLFRVFLEAYFIFGNMTRDPEFIPEYFSTDKAVRLKLMNAAKNHAAAPFKGINKYATEHVINTLKEEIKETQANEMNIFEYAQRIECKWIYDSLYRMVSATAHSSPRSLLAYISENPDGTIQEVKREPCLGDIPDRIFNLGDLLFNVYSGFNDTFGLEFSDEMRELQSTIETFVVFESNEQL